MLRCSRHRLRIALVVIFGLLFQQVAMAAYACTMPSMPPDPVEMAEDCADMGMERVEEAPAVCAEHCSPDRVVASDHVAPSVPALALPPPEFAPVLMPSVTHVALVAGVPLRRSDPPPRLRYCSLLI